MTTFIDTGSNGAAKTRGRKPRSGEVDLEQIRAEQDSLAATAKTTLLRRYDANLASLEGQIARLQVELKAQRAARKAVAES